MTMTLTELRTLTTLASRATAALIPLAADGVGRDHHGGRLANASETLREALAALEQAGLMAARLRAEVGASIEGARR